MREGARKEKVANTFARGVIGFGGAEVLSDSNSTREFYFMDGPSKLQRTMVFPNYWQSAGLYDLNSSIPVTGKSSFFY